MKTSEKPAEDRLLDKKEAAAILKVSIPTLDRWARNGVIKKRKQGQIVRYPMSEVQACIAALPTT